MGCAHRTAGGVPGTGHLVGRLQVAGRGEAQREVAPLEGLGHEDRLGFVFSGSGTVEKEPADEGEQDDDDDDPFADRFRPAAVDDGGEVLGGLGFHESGEKDYFDQPPPRAL